MVIDKGGGGQRERRERKERERESVGVFTSLRNGATLKSSLTGGRTHSPLPSSLFFPLLFPLLSAAQNIENRREEEE